MKTREQALADFSRVITDDLEISRLLTPLEAAQRAHHPGGPSVEVLAEQIAEARARRLARATVDPDASQEVET